MKTVLFAWELGGGFGHIASMRRYAARLAGHGIRMVAVVRNPKVARGLADLGVEVLRAPPWPEASFTSRQRAEASSATLGDSLAIAGLADPDALIGLLARWSDIFKSVRPDLVVADYAPAAALAARGRVPLMIAGNGYTVPPGGMTHFPILQRAVPPSWEEMRLLTIVNKAGHACGIAPLKRLPQLFSADDYFVETFPLLDPYDLQRTTPVDGPAFDRMPVAKRKTAGDILVYLAPGYAIRREVVGMLLPHAKKLKIYAPDLSFADRSRLKLAGAEIHNKQIDLADALASARLAVHFGGSGLASHAIAAGVPQLIIAAQIEQELNGMALERAKIGKLVRGHDPKAEIASAIVSGLLADTSLAEHAARSGEIHRDMLRGSDPLAAFESRSLNLLRQS